mgnify:CR=1 FL=1
MPVAGHPPHTTSQSHHHLLRPSRLCKIILGHQQITLLRNPWRVAKPRANHVQRELALELGLSARPHRVEQSWPTRDAGASQQSRHLAAKVGVLPTHRRLGCRSVLGSRDHVFTLVAEDLEGFVEDGSQLGKDRATTNPTTFVVFYLRLWNAHPVYLPVDVVPAKRQCFRRRPSDSFPSRCRPPIPEACNLGKTKNPHASILEMLEPFAHKFSGRAMFWIE